MQGSSLVSGQRYLLRGLVYVNKQTPVTFLGWKPGLREEPVAENSFLGYAPGRYLLFERVSNRELVTRRSAHAVSKHYDDCYLLTRENGCHCAERLAKEGK